MDEEQVRARLKELEWTEERVRRDHDTAGFTLDYGRYLALKEVLETESQAKESKAWVCLSAKKEFLGWVMGKDLSQAQVHLMYGEMGINIYGEPVVYLAESPAGDPVKVK